MRAPKSLLPLLFSLTVVLISPWVQAQTPAGNTSPPAQGIERSTEHIRVEDSGARIDEVRVGGETRSITVQPKGNMPAYEVLPNQAARGPAVLERESGSSGSRVWKILGF
ncbi:MAG: hypothetical protein WBI20_01760 [Burkholderiaceae bacterium]